MCLLYNLELHYHHFFLPFHDERQKRQRDGAEMAKELRSHVLDSSFKSSQTLQLSLASYSIYLAIFPFL